MSSHCCHSEPKTDVIPPLNRRLVIMGSAFLGVLLLSFLPILGPLNESMLAYLRIVWWAVLLGLVLGGIIDYFVPDGFVVRLLGGDSKLTLVNAVLAGFLMSACSHGILAIAIQLYKKGASVPAVITFLLASPWANLPMTVLLFGFFGIKALLFVGGAMAIALVTGVVFTVLDRLDMIEGPAQDIDAGDVSWDRVTNFEFAKATKGVAIGFVSLANMVLWWILLGILAAALIGAYVPEHFFMAYLGPDMTGMLVTLLFATVLEVCSEGTSPIAFEIFNKTAALGNPFVFLMAGVATDYTEIGLLWTNIGRRTAIWLPVVTVPQILLLGMWFNRL
ncbi:MAG: permease [Gammaproteobacteria bacterium]|nr:permease [Gammaproteobacteria bacterium]MBT8093731.1 permease [Gammaproteobacteria bacterium]MBT8105656.1 permease [Gammaproteobacteria bacterium]NNK25670.1 ATPase [Woeseiaceae bacterium]NNL63997.1 ATPase [Woeseiaceae bacterium]